MRGILAAIWGLIVCVVTIVTVGFVAILSFPDHTTQNNLMRIAGVIIGIGLGISAYRRSAKPPQPPASE